MIRRLRAILLAVVLLLAGLGGTVFFAGDYLLDRPQIRDVLITQAEQATAWQWTIGTGPRIRWRPLPEISLGQVTMQAPADHPQRPRLHAREVLIAFRWGSLLSAELQPASATALGLTGELDSTPNPATAVNPRVIAFDMAQAKVELVGASNATGPRLRELAIDGGQLSLSSVKEDGATRQDLQVTELSLKIGPLPLVGPGLDPGPGLEGEPEDGPGEESAATQVHARGLLLGGLPGFDADWSARMELTSSLAPVSDPDILELSDARIKIGALRLRRANLDLHGPAAELTGDLRLDRRAGLAKLENMQALMLGLRFHGQLSTALEQGLPTASGQLRIDPFDPRAWIESGELDQVPATLTATDQGFRSLAARLDFHLSPRALRVESLRLKLDDTEAQGRASLGFGAQPTALFSLSMDQLNLDRYLPSGDVAKAAARSSTTSASRADDELSLTASARTAHDLPPDGRLLKVSALAASEPAPTQPATQAAASSSPFWSALRASGEIEVQQFGLFKLNAGPIELKPRLQNLHLTTDFSAPDFYAGRIGGYLELTPVGTNAPALKLLAKGEGVQIGPLLSDLRTELSASGAAEIGLELTATGGDWAQISHSLGGDAALLLRDVRVEGIALDKLLRAKGLNLPATLAELPQLDVFTEMSASFQGGSGLFRSQDILARSPQVAISGTGLVELPTQRVDFDLNAVLQPKANEPDGIDLSGLELPLRIQGGWTAPRVTLDPGPALREAAARALERKLQKHQDKLRALEEHTGIKGLEQGLRQLLGTD